MYGLVLRVAALLLGLSSLDILYFTKGAGGIGYIFLWFSSYISGGWMQLHVTVLGLVPSVEPERAFFWPVVKRASQEGRLHFLNIYRVGSNYICFFINYKK